MSTTNSNGWKNWALAGMTGLAIGGGAGGYAGSTAAKEVRVELQAEIRKLQEENRSDLDTQITMSNAIVRIETKLDAVIERLERERR